MDYPLRKSEIDRNIDLKQYKKLGLSEEDIYRYFNAYNYFDRNKDGSIDFSELHEIIQALGFDNKGVLQGMLKDLDQDASGQINFDEFIHYMAECIYTRDKKLDFERVFNFFKESESDYITIKSLREIANQINEEVDESVLTMMINKAGFDGKVDLDGFYNILTKKLY